MINKRYKPVTVIKQRSNKITEFATISNNLCVLKSFPLNQSKSILNEIQVYKSLKDPHHNGFAQIIQAFEYDNRLYLAMQSLGPNLQFLRIQCGGRLSLKTVLMLGIKMIQRVEYLHKSGFLHNDIKPDNFLIGLDKMKHKLYLVDFQLSQPYLIKGKHIKEERLEAFSGSLSFISAESNRQRNTSRKDDIQSIYYTLIYLLKGFLPWSQLNATTIPEAYHLAANLKQTKTKELLEGLPDLFRQLFNDLAGVKFDEQPNYENIKKQFQVLMRKNGYEMDYKYDWEFL